MTTIRRAGRVVCLVVIVLLLIATTVPAATPPVGQAATLPWGGELQLLSLQPSLTVDERSARQRVAERLDQVSERAHVAVSVLDEASGAWFDHGTGRFETASLVKVHFVALMSWRARRTGEPLTAAQRLDAEQMLVRSENDPALRAYFALGGRVGVEQGLEDAYGTSGVRIGDQGYWGHSVTSPRDVVKLLERVLDPASAPTYALLQDAMSRVVPSQRFGVSVLADRDTTVQTKVGWVRDPEGWVVNSSGRVLVDGSPVIISVMTDQNPTLEDGIVTIEEVARLVGEMVRDTRAEAELGWHELGTRISDFESDPS